VMVKVPATPESIPAIEALLAQGINVNITLLFSIEHYEEVGQAFMRGATRSPRPGQLASVASVFVNRVDAAVDCMLGSIRHPEALELRGEIGIANAKIIYQRFREIFLGPAFAELRARGVHVQRLLWGSTGERNPAYSDVR